MKRNKLGSFLLAVSIALGLWLYVVNYIDTDYELTLDNVSVGLEGKSVQVGNTVTFTYSYTSDVTERDGQPHISVRVLDVK